MEKNLFIKKVSCYQITRKNNSFFFKVNPFFPFGSLPEKGKKKEFFLMVVCLLRKSDLEKTFFFCFFFWEKVSW